MLLNVLSKIFPKQYVLRAKWEAKLRLFLLAKRYPLLDSLSLLDNLSGVLFGVAVTSASVYYLAYFLARKSRTFTSKMPMLLSRIIIDSNKMITPFAFTYVLTHIYLYLGSGLSTARRSKIRLFKHAPYIELWLLAEVVHFVFHKIQKKRLQSLTRPSGMSPQKRRQILVEMCDAIKDPDDWINSWFLNAKVDEVKEMNIKQFLSYSFFGAFLRDLTMTERMELHSSYQYFCKHTNLTFPHGYNPKAKFMRHTLDPFVSQHHPLLNYGIVQFGDLVCRLFLKYMGFKRARNWRLSYWYRLAPKEEEAAEKPPVVFIHGIGIGISIYLNFISNLLKHENDSRNIFLLELPHISMRMSKTIPSPDETCDAIEIMLSRHLNRNARVCSPAPPAVFMGHSFGSIIVTWMVARKPNCVAQAIMLDPVSMCLYLPNVLLTFIYRKPQTADQHIRNYFLSTELYIIHALTRHFWWYDNVLQAVDVLPHMDMVVLLSSKDEIVPVEGIQCWIDDNFSDRKHPIKTLLYPDFEHGSFLGSLPAQQDIFDNIISKSRINVGSAFDQLLYEDYSAIPNDVFNPVCSSM